METTQTLRPSVDAPASSRFGPLVFAGQIAILLAAVYATVVAFAYFVKDATDYADASVLKHQLLAMDAPKKYVLVGGSNISYGLDSNVIMERTGCPVVNMGMNGYFGVRFMLDEVKPYLNAGDIVVIAWEYDSFVKSVDGTDTDLLMVTKANPRAFAFLTPEQKIGVFMRYPYVAQQKAFRIFREAVEDARQDFGKAFGRNIDASTDEDVTALDPDYVSVIEVESLKSFDILTGDLDGHTGLHWPYDLEESLDLTRLSIDDQIVPMMSEFIREMTEKDVRVMISWTALLDSSYAEHKDRIEEINALLASDPIFLIPRPAREFVFDPKYHFDTVYHLNDEGRAIRSPMVADDIIAQFGNDALCNPVT